MTAETPSAAMPRAPQSIQDVLDILGRHRRRGAAVFAGMLALVVLGLCVCPRTYESEAKLYVRVGRESIGLDPTATTGQSISLSDSREFEMNSVMDVIDSRTLLDRVVDAVGAEVILSGKLPEIPATASITPPSRAGSAASPLDRDKAIRALSDALKTTSSKRSSVISVACKSGTPELAQHILQSFVNAFLALHLDASRVSGSHAFFEEQCRLLSAQLDSATRELSAAKSAVGLTSIEGRQKTLEDQVNAIQTAAGKNASALAASEATLGSLRETLASLPEKLISQEVTGFPDDSIGVTRKHLADLRLKEQELLVRYTPQHPYVEAVRGQIAAGEKMLSQPDPQVRQATRSNNPTHDQLQLRLLSEEATAAALRAEGEALREQSQKLAAKLEALNAGDSQITRLQQRVDVLKTSLKGYTEKLEQARIDQALAAERISNVSVVQPATYSPRPVSPKKAFVLMAGFLVAAISALGAVFGSEYLRPELLRTPLRNTQAS